MFKLAGKFLHHILPGVVRPLHVLWNQVIGFFFLAAGLYLLARGSKRARRHVKVMRRRLPFLSRGLNRAKHRLPRSLRVFIERSDPGA